METICRLTGDGGGAADAGGTPAIMPPTVGRGGLHLARLRSCSMPSAVSSDVDSPAAPGAAAVASAWGGGGVAAGEAAAGTGTASPLATPFVRFFGGMAF